MKRAQLFAAVCWFSVSVLGALAAHAQTAPQNTVTIFTDGLAYPNGRTSQALTELAAALGQAGKRVLPVMAAGGEGNVRDLLRFKGADLAIVNADVLSAAAVEKAHPDARRKLRSITRLYGQRVFLLARPEIKGVEQLAGKKVAVLGPESVTRLTASTLFARLKVNAELIAAPATNAADAFAGSAAILFLDDDAARLSPAIAQSGAFAPLPIKSTPVLAAVYRPGIIPADQAAFYGGQGDVETVAVDTILAAFDWTAAHGRYLDVTGFIDTFFAAIPKLRRDHPGSIWNDTDPRAEILGWQRYAYAETARKAVPAVSRDAVAAARFSPPAATVPVAVTGAAPAGAGDQVMQLSVLAKPPLTDQRSPGGGLITELAMAAIQRAGPPYGRAVLQWEKDAVGQLKAVLSDQSAQLALPWEEVGCDEPQALGLAGAAICDGGLVSAPLLKVLVLFFSAADGSFAFTGDESLAGRTICLPSDRDPGSLGPGGKKLADEGKLTLVRPASLIECLALVERGEADAVLASDLEGRQAIASLGRAAAFRISELPASTRSIHIVLAKDAPGADQRLAALNQGIVKLKAESAYSEMIARHLAKIQAGD